MMEFTLEALAPVLPKLTTAEPTKEFTALDALVAQLKSPRSSHLTPISVPRYFDFVAENGTLIVTENFSD